MKKLLVILFLCLSMTENADALIFSCKSIYRAEVVHHNIYDLTEGGRWNPEYTDKYIFWTELKITKGSGDTARAIAVYNELDRFTGNLKQGFSFNDYVKSHMKKNRINAVIDYYLDGNCKKKKNN